MNPPWTAECVVSADRARTLIEAQFPQLEPARVEPFGAGWDNTAFLVNGGLVFRFPRRQFAVPFLASETRLLPVLAPLLPLPVPSPAFVGRPAADYPWPFAGYALLPGRTACAADLNDEQRTHAADVLGRFLAVLHSPAVAEVARRHGAGPDPIDRLNMSRAIPTARRLLDQLAARGLVEDARPFAVIIDAAPTSYTPRTDALVHGDLYVRHLLVNDANELAGVIDWGDVHLGDPALDCLIALTYLPPSARPTFARAYGRFNDIAWEVARFRGLRHTLHVLDYAHGIGAADLLRECHRALQHLSAL
jgi:aminoglycoside phosphotransferase (APT) family kinase protein